MVDNELTLSDFSLTSLRHSQSATQSEVHARPHTNVRLTRCVRRLLPVVCAAMNNPSESGHVQCFYVSFARETLRGRRLRNTREIRKYQKCFFLGTNSMFPLYLSQSKYRTYYKRNVLNKIPRFNFNASHTKSIRVRNTSSFSHVHFRCTIKLYAKYIA